MGSGGNDRLDCYEDMFKEITRKLYGEDPDHRTSSIQNEFETSVSYKTEEESENMADNDEAHWTCEEEPLKGTDGSRIAAYHPIKCAWRCYECGENIGGGPREVAEHFMELHSSRILVDESRRHQSPHMHNESIYDLKDEDVIAYLERVRERADRALTPSRRTQETQTVSSALVPMAASFAVQDHPGVPGPSGVQHVPQNPPALPQPPVLPPVIPQSNKRYTCPFCPYGTDRRDLYTRHENIHREDKPFHCYLCLKPFNRADHVKKHFLRMHREHGYELSRIRKIMNSKSMEQTITSPSTQNGQHVVYPAGYSSTKPYSVGSSQNSNGTAAAVFQSPSVAVSLATGQQPETTNGTPNKRAHNGGCNSKNHLKGAKGEKKYTCCYCSWSGVDNWCLKRHLNTHLKPFVCSLCEYKAARAERLATHVLKVHNKRQCGKCSFYGEDAADLHLHQAHVHRTGPGATASATVTSATAQSIAAANRQVQQLQSVTGGRPPPGPPVFPASTTIVAPAPVLPPTTLLGHKMVMSPATAATTTYSWDAELDDDRDDSVVEGRGRIVAEHDHDHEDEASDVVDDNRCASNDHDDGYASGSCQSRDTDDSNDFMNYIEECSYNHSVMNGSVVLMHSTYPPSIEEVTIRSFDSLSLPNDSNSNQSSSMGSSYSTRSNPEVSSISKKFPSPAHLSSLPTSPSVTPPAQLPPPPPAVPRPSPSTSLYSGSPSTSSYSGSSTTSSNPQSPATAENSKEKKKPRRLRKQLHPRKIVYVDEEDDDGEE